jgi:hypothetical protein
MRSSIVKSAITIPLLRMMRKDSEKKELSLRRRRIRYL